MERVTPLRVRTMAARLPLLNLELTPGKEPLATIWERHTVTRSGIMTFPACPPFPNLLMAIRQHPFIVRRTVQTDNVPGPLEGTTSPSVLVVRSAATLAFRTVEQVRMWISVFLNLWTPELTRLVTQSRALLGTLRCLSPVPPCRTVTCALRLGGATLIDKF